MNKKVKTEILYEVALLRCELITLLAAGRKKEIENNIDLIKDSFARIEHICKRDASPEGLAEDYFEAADKLKNILQSQPDGIVTERGCLTIDERTGDIVLIEREK